MKVFTKFDEIPSMTLQDIKETKRYGHTFVRSDGRTDGQRENIIPSHKTQFAGGIKHITCTVTAQLICAFVLHMHKKDVAHLMFYLHFEFLASIRDIRASKFIPNIVISAELIKCVFDNNRKVIFVISS